MRGSVPSARLLAVLVAALAAGLCLACDAPRERPSFLVVSIDTLRADHVGCYGGPAGVSPTIDALAAAGLRFEAAFSPAPLTLPSHTTLLSGLEPPHHGVRHNGIHRVPPEVDMLAERFAAAGWATGGVAGSTILAAKTGIAQGFAFYDDRIQGSIDNTLLRRPAAEVADAALGWLAKAPRPYFLFVHFYDPHAAYEPPAPFDRGYPSLYDGEIAYADSQLARLVGALEARDELGSTVLVVTADHGESLGEHGERTHGYFVYDATQHVPLVMRGPGLPAGRSVAALARLSDVAPTLAAVAGLPPSPSDGRDLAELWGEGAPATRVAYLEALAGRYEQGWAPVYGIRSLTHLFLRAPRPELYAVKRDPGQRAELLSSEGLAHAPVAAALAREIDRALAGERQPLAVTLDGEELAQLRALGYALPDETPAAGGQDPKDVLPAFAAFTQSEEELAAQRFAEAARLLRGALKAMPGSGRIHQRLGLALLNLGDHAGALAHSQRATQLAPYTLGNWLQLARVQTLAGAPHDALASLAVAEGIDPQERLVLVQKMEALVRLGRLEEAERAAQAAIALAPAEPELRARIADAWEDAGDAERAAGAYLAHLALVPDSPRSHMHAAVHLARLGRTAESDAHLRRAAEVREEPEARLALARAYELAGAIERARAELSALASSESPVAAEARAALARLAASASSPGSGR